MLRCQNFMPNIIDANKKRSQQRHDRFKSFATLLTSYRFCTVVPDLL
jgi:hypothetical protein